MVRGETGIWGFLTNTAWRLVLVALLWLMEWLKSRVKMWSMKMTAMMTMRAF